MTFDEFAARHLAAVQRFAAVLAGDQTRGDDLVQEVLVRAHARWRRIGSMDRPEFYVRKMIVNEFLSSRRRTWRLVPAGSGTDIDRRVTPDHAASHADRGALLAELGKLPAQQRAVLVLRYYEGLSDGRIAELLGLAPGTVRGYASRALAALRSMEPPAADGDTVLRGVRRRVARRRILRAGGVTGVTGVAAAVTAVAVVTGTTPGPAIQRVQTAAYIVQHAAAAEAGAARMIQVTRDRAGVSYLSVATQRTLFVSSLRTSHGWPLLASADNITGTTYTSTLVDYKDRAYTVNSASTLDAGPWGAKGIVIGSWMPGVTARDPASAYTAALRRGIIKVVGYRNLNGRQTILIQVVYQKAQNQTCSPARRTAAPSSSGSASSGPSPPSCETLPPGTHTCKRVPLEIDQVWLDASTYLEVQAATIAPKTVGGSAPDGPGVRPTCAKVVGWSTTTTRVDWLPPTKHNLALLNLTPPAGFTQVSNQKIALYLGPYS